MARTKRFKYTGSIASARVELEAAQVTKDKTRYIHQHGQPKICPACRGSGEVTGPSAGGMELIDCNRCSGTGKLRA